MWRKEIVLSATFLLAICVFSTSCKKKESLLGQSAIDQNDLLTSGVQDTFSLHTYTILEDSVISDNPAFALLGSYNDPVFGNVSSEFYTQLLLEQTAPDFGDLNTISIDSFVLGIEYTGYYGVTGNQVFEVFEITDPNGLSLDSTYYSFSTLNVDSDNLIATGEEILEMNPDNLTVVGTDTIDAQLRIQLDTLLAWQFLNDSQLMPTAFSSNDEFLNYFKGLNVRTNNGPQASGDGGVFYFNLNDAFSKATIYYTQDGEQKTFDFLMTSEGADFNHVVIDNAGTNVETVINDTISGQTEYYAQSFGSRAIIEIPGLDNIPSNAVIHKAILRLPIQNHPGTDYIPGSDVTVSTRIDENDPTLFSIGVLGTYNSFGKRFDIDLRAYVQSIVEGSIDNTGIVV